MLYGYRSDVRCRYTDLRRIIILLSIYFLVKKVSLHQPRCVF